eukprot:TRINITY_DN60357_c0_g1_i1.p1 TRINITY_DN60357_c0_g1~~TRINITY_DN60357_c0_g1_i1.p1  ORF type:complete len:790 (+),score=192.56 TRINITY_DN60357_c0_g1_i1:51-2420(+)
MASATERMHHEIEVMTRRLELEKRRLNRLEKELGAARKTQVAKAKSFREMSDKASSTPRSRSSRPSSGGSGAAAARCLSARASTATSSQACSSYASPTGNDDVLGREELEALPMKNLVSRMKHHLKSLDDVRHDNVRLREEVDKIRKHKKQFSNIFERLKAHIRQRTEQLQDFIEETAQSKGIAREALDRVAVMKKQREHERQQFKTEVMRIRKDLKAYEVEKREVEVHLKRADTGVQKKNELIEPDEELEFSESEMMRRIMKTAFLNCIQRRHIRQHQKSIEVFEQAFATIKQSTGISNIEEIVKIFVSLESRNYSLLTYVNHMNRDIEALEGIRRGRREAELHHAHVEEQTEKEREAALGDMQKKLQATQLAMEDSRDVCYQHREILRQVLPAVAQVSKRLQAEGSLLRSAVKEADGSEFPARPSDELREDTLLSWLSWFESALSRFKDLMPNADASKDVVFPATAASLIKALQPKRQFNHQPPPLVKPAELPSAPTAAEDLSSAAQKRQLLSAPKGDDEDSEEEDFGDRPLMLKDIRERAEQGFKRKRRRETNRKTHLSSEFAHEAKHEVTRTPTQEDQTPTLDARRSVKIRFGESSDPPDVVKEPSPGDKIPSIDGQSSESDLGSDEEAKEALETDAVEHPASPHDVSGSEVHPRMKKLMELADQDRQEISQDELEALFLKSYKMSTDELKVLASRMRCELRHLCFLKKQFDSYDHDQSTYISASELPWLMKKLGQDLSDRELEAAIKELEHYAKPDDDACNLQKENCERGMVEFFELAEWFTGT